MAEARETTHSPAAVDFWREVICRWWDKYHELPTVADIARRSGAKDSSLYGWIGTIRLPQEQKKAWLVARAVDMTWGELAGFYEREAEESDTLTKGRYLESPKLHAFAGVG